MPYRVYTICRDCGLLVRPGRLDVHSRCRATARETVPAPAPSPMPVNKPPVHLAIVAGAPCSCPVCTASRKTEAR